MPANEVSAYCPNCQNECCFFFMHPDGEIIGCEHCISRTDAVQYILDSREDYIYEQNR